MSKLHLTSAEKKVVDGLVKLFEEKRYTFETLVKNLANLMQDSPRLSQHIHSIKYRVKAPSHLKEKLTRKLLEAKKQNKKFLITPDNLFLQLTDLAGLRILHLHTSQMKAIDFELKAILDEQRYKIVEGPIANTWDHEYRKFFDGLGFKTVARDSLYTSIHYIVEPGQKTALRCEIQVRTLMEEVWGEVSHSVNYPHSADNIACEEQLKVLARVTTSGTRLVDSIFKCKTHYAKSKT